MICIHTHIHTHNLLEKNVVENLPNLKSRTIGIYCTHYSVIKEEEGEEERERAMGLPPPPFGQSYLPLLSEFI